MHEDAAHGDARLPSVEHQPEPRGLRRHREVRVFEDEHGIAAGEFERARDEPFAEPGRELAADAIRSRKHDVIDVRLGELRTAFAGGRQLREEF